ncbi:hypothetical protein LSAT2_011611 [Lamellibrachia satsuma]|nr:hypothetical protein LSAT2_011611 [Lamellibrachia satsuma]
MPSHFHSTRNTTRETNTSLDSVTGKRKGGDGVAPPDLPPGWWPFYRDKDVHFYNLMTNKMQTGLGEQLARSRPSRNRSPTRTPTFTRIIDVLPRIETPVRRSLHPRQRSRSAGRWPSFNDIRRLHAGSSNRNGHVCGLADNGSRFSSEAGNSLEEVCSCVQVQRYPGQGSVGPPAPPPSMVEDSLSVASPTGHHHFVVIPCGSTEDEPEDDRSNFFITATKDDTPLTRQYFGQPRDTATELSNTDAITAIARCNMAELGKRYAPHISARLPSGKAVAFQQRAAFNPYRPVRVRHKDSMSTSPSVRFAYARSPTPWSPISTMLLEHSNGSLRGDSVLQTTHGVTHANGAQR